MFLLGKCHLDIGHRGSRSPSRSKFNHIALPGPVLTLISLWLVQEYDLPCFSPGTLLPASLLWPERASSIHADTKLEQLSRSMVDLHDLCVCRSVVHRGMLWNSPVPSYGAICWLSCHLMRACATCRPAPDNGRMTGVIQAAVSS